MCNGNLYTCLCEKRKLSSGLGINKDTPKHPAVVLDRQNHEFFIEEEDEWFFDQNDLTVSVEDDEIRFKFHN